MVSRLRQIIWGILVTPGTGSGGPRLAVTQVGSGLARRLDCVESQAAAPRRLFSEVEWRHTMQGPWARSGWANKEGGVWVWFAPTQHTSGTDQRGAKQGGLLVPAGCRWTEWRLRVAQRSEGLGWKLGTCDYYSPDWAPFLGKTLRENRAQLPLPAGTGKTCKTSKQAFFFFSISQAQDSRTRSWEKTWDRSTKKSEGKDQQLRQISLCSWSEPVCF